MQLTALVKNTAYLTLASTAQKAIAFLYFAYVSDYFGTATTGAYFVALGIVTTLAVLEDLGLTSVLIREIAKDSFDPKRWMRAVMGVKLVTVPIMVLVSLFGLRVIGAALGLVPGAPVVDAEVELYVQLGIGLLIADTLSLTFYGVLRGVKDLRFESIGIFIGQLLTAGIGGALIFTGQATLPLILMALTVGSVWNIFFAGYFVAKRLGLGAFVPSFSLAVPMLKMAVAFFIGALFVKLMSYFDSAVLLLTHGKEEVGVYAVAYKFTYAFQFLPLVFIAALYPEMSSPEQAPGRLRKITLDSFWYMALIGVPIVFGLWAIAPQLIDLFYDVDEFGGSILALQVLVFVLLFIFADFPLGSLLNAKDRQGVKTVITGVSLLVNVIANVILTPKFGAVGASVSAIITFVVMLALDWIYARDLVDLSIWEIVRRTGGLFAAGAVMGLAVYLIQFEVSVLVAVPFGAVVYLGLAWLFGGIHAEYLEKVSGWIYARRSR